MRRRLLHGRRRVDDLGGNATGARALLACHAVAVSGMPSLTGAALAAIALLGAGPAAHAAVPETTTAAGWARVAGVRVQPETVLRPGAVRVPARGALSLTLRATPRTGLRITGDRGALVADLRARADGGLTVRTPASTTTRRRARRRGRGPIASSSPAAGSPWTACASAGRRRSACDWSARAPAPCGSRR